MVSQKTALIIAIPALLLLVLIVYDRMETDAFNMELDASIEKLCEDLWDYRQGGDVPVGELDLDELDTLFASGEYSRYTEYRANCLDYFHNQKP